MTVAFALLVIAATIWAVLIAGWWVFWLRYSKGRLRPASWRAVLTMPAWSVRSVFHGLRDSPPKAASTNPFRALSDRLRTFRDDPPTDVAQRRRLIRALHHALATAPPGTPKDLIEEFRQTLRLLEELNNSAGPGV
jgi:hypothetical protein